MANYYIRDQQGERGPFAPTQLRTMWDMGAITADASCRVENADDWMPLCDVMQSPPQSLSPPKIAVPVTAGNRDRGNQPSVAIDILPVIFPFFLLVAFFAAVGGNYHFVSGNNVAITPVRRLSFGFSEMFIDVDAITGMPRIAAQSRYPLSYLVLQREGILQSEERIQAAVRQKSVSNAILNNLRQISAAADHYYLEHGVVQVTLDKLVGPGTYIRSLQVVDGEDYTSLDIRQGGEFTVTSRSGITVTYK